MPSKQTFFNALSYIHPQKLFKCLINIFEAIFIFLFNLAKFLVKI
jgi:hypothetical protein